MAGQMVCGRGGAHGRHGGGPVPRNAEANLRDPRDIDIECLQRRIQELELLHHDSPNEETESDSSV